jgi:hypothetical protein
MLLFHGSAALVDSMILLIVPRILQGRLLDRTQYLLIASVLGNFAGWLLYMGYAPPGIYDGYMWALTVAQIGCLLFTDRPHADSPWLDLVRHRARIGGGNHT